MSKEPLRVLLWGLGAMGSGMARILLEKEGVEIVAAVAQTSAKAGKDLGEVLGVEKRTGVTVTNDIGNALNTKPDVVLLNTASFVKEVFPQIKLILERGSNVITIAEEMAYPWASEPGLSDEIDRLAKAAGKTVLGTGINPGFILDTLVIALTGICAEVKHIHAKRVNNLAPFGPTVMRTQGVGTTPEGFREGLGPRNSRPRRVPAVGHLIGKC